MKEEKYCFTIGEEGQKGLGILDYCFDASTQEFLLDNHLKSAKRVLDVGCGTGEMSLWIANQLSPSGQVIAIDNNQNQLNVAIRQAKQLNIKNIQFQLLSIYDLSALQMKFDFVYCRFLLHHLNDSDKAIGLIDDCLETDGIFVSEEGIMNSAFSYPESTAFLTPHEQFVEGKPDKNIGCKLYYKLKQKGFSILQTRLVQPVLTTHSEKELLIPGVLESKEFFLSQGHTETEWQQLYQETQKLVENDMQIVGFYGSGQVAGKKIKKKVAVTP